MSIEEWLAKADDVFPRSFGIRRATTFAPLGEKSSLDRQGREVHLGDRKRPRSILQLPFAQQTFEQICERFQVHGSIVRTLTRSDVPTFSCDNVAMNGEAFGKKHF